MNKLDTAIRLVEKYEDAARFNDGYNSGCVLTALELNTLASLLRSHKAELTVDIMRAP